MLSPPLSPYPGIDVVGAGAAAARKSGPIGLQSQLHHHIELRSVLVNNASAANAAANASASSAEPSAARLERQPPAAEPAAPVAVPVAAHRRQPSTLDAATRVPSVPTRVAARSESPDTTSESVDAETDDDSVDGSVDGSIADTELGSDESTARKRTFECPPSPRQRSMTTCWDSLVSNPAKYLKRERSFLELYPMRRHSWTSPGVFDGAIDGSVGSVGGRSAIRRRRGPVSGRARRFGSYGPDDGVPGFRRRAASAVADRQSSDCSDTELEGRAKSSSPGAEGKKRSSSGGGAAPSRVHDMSLHQLEDFSPPITTLPPGRSLRAEWKGAPMDLSNDPDVHLLHPAEVHLASVLRLPCEVYLDSKRRLFAEKVHRLRQRLPFRRTDSQKACRIDVNKASRLFGAFERVGWLENELFEKYLN